MNIEYPYHTLSITISTYRRMIDNSIVERSCRIEIETTNFRFRVSSFQSKNYVISDYSKRYSFENKI